ncbi:MAG: glycosyltransferase family 1 protein [Deltaproteobacteria bacterium]|nr:glycosyltransferase family 1 protein [Deltaproteobacteria bacterium]
MHLPDFVVLSHLRWGFVLQRPQHLMTRFARSRRVFFVEEPIFHDGPPRMKVTEPAPNVFVAVPLLPHHHSHAENIAEQRRLLDELLGERRVHQPIAWFYTPMAMPFARHLAASAVIWDCMDELSHFAFAPKELVDLERELLAHADLVFTGGHSLYEAKRDRHHSVHAFPSSVDAEHFAAARGHRRDPVDQASLGHPRLGFYGVVDERFDTELVAAVADARPDWNLVVVGPVAKIDPRSLPRRANIRWIGQRGYAELPAYLSGWDVAIMPFALNDATKYISPTKTLEFLAGGKPVVSTPIRDVVRPYGEHAVVRIAGTPDEFVAACAAALSEDAGERIARADAVLSQTSWDRTHARMAALIDEVCERRRGRHDHPNHPREAACSTI